ncbi:hypothetical protein EP331_03790 [bacterium]|nr:MAG: hypothetical protein EP331_03790 [bacterium]
MLFKSSSAGASKSVLKPVLILSAILLVLWMITLSQSGDNTSQEQTTVEEQARIDSLRLILGTTESRTVEKKGDNLFNSAFPVFLLLILGIAGVWWWSQKKGTPANVISNVVAEQEIGPGQFIKIVSLGDEYLVLGVTPQSVNLLKSISKQDWDPSALVNQKAQTTSIFSQMLKRAEGNENA